MADNIFFFFQSMKPRNYLVSTPKDVLDMIEKKQFSKIIYAYDKFENYEKVNSDLEEKLKIYTKDNKPIDVEYDENDSSETIIKKITDVYSFKPNDTVHIAINGGIRSNVMFFSTFVQILQCNKVKTRLYYSKEEKDDNGKNVDKTIDVSDNNDYYDILRGVELFIETGNPFKFIECYKDKCDSEDLNELFELMTKFYEYIQICRRVQKNGLIDTYCDLLKKIDDLISDDSSIPVTLKLLLSRIKNSFANKKIDRSSNEENKEDIVFIQIINWCLDNKLITHAYFILNVELTRFFMERGIFKNCYPEKSELFEIFKESSKFNEETFKYYKNSKSYDEDNMDILIKGYISYISKNKEDEFKEEKLRAFGFEFDDFEICKECILICTLVRRIRNSIAHSNNYDILDNHEVLLPLTDKYNECKSIYTFVNTGGNDKQKSIPASGENYYKICEYILTCVVNDIKEIIKGEKNENLH